MAREAGSASREAMTKSQRAQEPVRKLVDSRFRGNTACSLLPTAFCLLPLTPALWNIVPNVRRILNNLYLYRTLRLWFRDSGEVS